MNVTFTTSSTPPNLQQTQGSNQIQQSGNTTPTNRTLTVTIATGTQGSGPTALNAITLSYPLIGPEDIAIHEVTQQLKNLDLNALRGMTLTAAVLKVNETLSSIADAIIKGGPGYVRSNADAIIVFFDGIQKQAEQAETQLFDLISNSTYPDFNKFLGEMLTAAQDLRELASKAKHSLVMAEYANICAQATNMKDAAQKNYDSTMKEIKAARTEANGQIISGSVGLVFTVVGARLGGSAGAQLGAGLGETVGKIAEGSSKHAASKIREDGAKLKFDADVLDTVRKTMEATQKLLQESESTADELRDIGKSLADMVLKLLQDFISNQNQVNQRANI